MRRAEFAQWYKSVMKRLALVLAVFLSFAVVSNVALASTDSLRCGNKLVRAGDGKDKVRAICGEPTSVSFEGVMRGPRYVYGPYGYGSYFGPSWVEVPVEIWTYNLGSNKLLRKLRFVGDSLEVIWTDGYGY